MAVAISSRVRSKSGTVTRRIRFGERWTTGVIASGGDETRNAGICPRFCSRQEADMARTDAPGVTTGKPLIESDRVEGTAVYDRNDNHIGSIERLMIEKKTGK